jgi:hypothetical protein
LKDRSEAAPQTGEMKFSRVAGFHNAPVFGRCHSLEHFFAATSILPD